MLSHPIIIMTVVASSDKHPIGLLQQLAATHHSIPGIAQGLYEPEIQRIYVLLHDIGDNPTVDPDAMFSQMQKMYPYHVRKLCLNSLTQETSNLSQPDYWASTVLPKFFLAQTSVYSTRYKLDLILTRNCHNLTRILNPPALSSTQKQAELFGEAVCPSTTSCR